MPCCGGGRLFRLLLRLLLFVHGSAGRVRARVPRGRVLAQRPSRERVGGVERREPDKIRQRIVAHAVQRHLLRDTCHNFSTSIALAAENLLFRLRRYF